MKLFNLVSEPETDFKVFIGVGILSLLLALILPHGLQTLPLGSLGVANLCIGWRLLRKVRSDKAASKDKVIDPHHVP